jgi:S2P endopeptidase
MKIRRFNNVFNKTLSKSIPCKLFASLALPLGLVLPFLAPFILCWLFMIASNQQVLDLLQVLEPPSFIHVARPISRTIRALSLTIPGLTLSARESILWMLAMFLSTLWHELGHAISASAHGIPLHGSGLFLFILFPGAYVELDTKKMSTLSPWKQLSIISSGAFNNLIAALVSRHMLFNLPYYLSWGYEISKAGPILVTSQSGFRSGYLVKAVNDLHTENLDQFKRRLFELSHSPFAGPSRCLSFGNVYRSECCFTSTMNLTNIECVWDIVSVEILAMNTGAYLSGLEIIPKTCFSFDAVEYLKNNPDSCFEDSDCPVDTCVVPVSLGATKSLTFQLDPFLEFPESAPMSTTKPVPYNVTILGDPLHLLSKLTLGTLIPKHQLLPYQFPFIAETLLRYLFAINMGLVIFNMMPCFLLDGRQALEVIPHILGLDNWFIQKSLGIFQRSSEFLILFTLILSIMHV